MVDKSNVEVFIIKMGVIVGGFDFENIFLYFKDGDIESIII